MKINSWIFLSTFELLNAESAGTTLNTWTDIRPWMRLVFVWNIEIIYVSLIQNQ